MLSVCAAALMSLLFLLWNEKTLRTLPFAGTKRIREQQTAFFLDAHAIYRDEPLFHLAFSLLKWKGEFSASYTDIYVGLEKLTQRTYSACTRGVFLKVLEWIFENFAQAAKSDAKGILDESCAVWESWLHRGTRFALSHQHIHTQTHPLVMCTPISSKFRNCSPSDAKSWFNKT